MESSEHTKTGSRRRVQKEETRRLLCEAAYELFEEKGYDRTTMRELAARAGVGLGTIFQHFPDKQTLLVATFRDEINAETEKAFETMPAGHVRNKLLHTVRCYFEYYARRPSLSRVILKEVFFLAPGHWSEILVEDVSAFFGKSYQVVAEGVAKGEIRETLDIQTAVLAYWSFYSTVLMSGFKEREFNLDTMMSMFSGMLDQHLGFAEENIPRNSSPMPDTEKKQEY